MFNFNPYDDFVDFEDFVAYEIAYPEYEPPRTNDMYDAPDEDYIRFLASMSDEECEEYFRDIEEQEGSEEDW